MDIGDYGDPAFLARLTNDQLRDEIAAAARLIRHLNRCGFPQAFPRIVEVEKLKGAKLREEAEKPGRGLDVTAIIKKALEDKPA